MRSHCSKSAILRQSSIISSHKKWKIQKVNRVLLSAVCASFSELLIKIASVYSFHNQNVNLRLGLQKQNTIFIKNNVNISKDVQIDKLVYRSDLETTNLASFPSKSFSYTVISSFLRNLSILTVAKFATSTRTDITLQTSMKWMRAMCCTFNLNVSTIIAILSLMGLSIVRTECVLGNFACTIKHFICLKVLNINVFYAPPCFKSVAFPLKNKRIRFPWCVRKG